MNCESIRGSEIKLFTPRIFNDHRGNFFESWNEQSFSSFGIFATFVQDNQSVSKKGVLRGLHYQIEQTQGKLVRVADGAAFVVAVDLRRCSKLFGNAFCTELDSTHNQSLWVPAGFAHGYLALAENTCFLYKCTDFYAPQHERTLLWNDQAIDIKWPIDRVAEIIISDRDAIGKSLSEAELFA